MATSTISFQGVLDSTGSCEFNFTPPSNISDKICYVEVKSFGLSWPTAPASPEVYDTYLLNSSWSQIQSMSVEPYGSGPYYKTVTLVTGGSDPSLNTLTPVSFTASGTYLTGKASTTDKVGAIVVSHSSGSTVLNVTSGPIADVAVGMYMTGVSIPNNAKVTAVDTTANTITINKITSSSATATTLTIFKNSVVITAPDAKIVAGLKVTGTGIVDDPTTVTASTNSGANVTLSSYINAATPTLAFTANTLTYTGTITGLDVGDTVTATGIPSGTTVTAINTATNTITLSNYLTAALNAATVTFSQTQMTIKTTGLSVGMTVSGLGIADGTTITGISGGDTIFLSRELTSATTVSTYTFRTPLSQMTQKLNAPLASLSYRGDSQGAPVLVYIPAGIQSVKFTVTRLDRTAVTDALNLLVMATMVDARSRPIPL
jgi:hypothetical protein